MNVTEMLEDYDSEVYWKQHLLEEEMMYVEHHHALARALLKASSVMEIDKVVRSFNKIGTPLN